MPWKRTKTPQRQGRVGWVKAVKAGICGGRLDGAGAMTPLRLPLWTPEMTTNRVERISGEVDLLMTTVMIAQLYLRAGNE